jgi:hypothetical protein
MRDVELEFEAELEDLMAVLSESNLAAESETSDGDIMCTGCADTGCLALVHSAIREAINLANGAADKLEAAIQPGTRDKDAELTAHFFQTFFCHDPRFSVPGDHGQPSGAIVAQRFRAVAYELGPGRRVRFECRPTIDNCDFATCCGAGDFSFFENGLSTIFLCARFWDARSLGDLGGQPLRGLNDPRLQLVNQRFRGLSEDARRAGIIIHEMLHILFDLGDDGSPRRFDAHCYAAFALRVNGYGGDPTAVRQCVSLPCGG